MLGPFDAKDRTPMFISSILRLSDSVSSLKLFNDDGSFELLLLKLLLSFKTILLSSDELPIFKSIPPIPSSSNNPPDSRAEMISES